MTRFGTSYFVSFDSACRYYRLQERTTHKHLRAIVATKLCEGLIHIGVPHLKEGEVLSIIDRGTRYAITAK